MSRKLFKKYKPDQTSHTVASNLGLSCLLGPFGPKTLGIFFFFFFFFWNWVLQPFQEYFTYIELIVHQGGRKPENPGKNHLTICKQNGFRTYDLSEVLTTAVRNLMD